ncbi:N-acetylmuramoyl-L-alanine amidase, partial [Bacillus subtilis]|nr:N-acetylmuramoyl-L-alanine amidase [Bacillus subtilis]MCR4383573.1 N-acetylmuramoyl-L-alanine amidase [Bacillus subtilis]
MTIAVKKNLVSEAKYPLKCPNPMTAEYITIHNTANDASAANEISYMIGNT